MFLGNLALESDELLVLFNDLVLLLINEVEVSIAAFVTIALEDVLNLHVFLLALNYNTLALLELEAMLAPGVVHIMRVHLKMVPLQCMAQLVVLNANLGHHLVVQTLLEQL